MAAIPSLLRMRPVPPAAAAAGGPIAAASQSNEVAGFALTCQQEDFWCWAAVTQAVELWAGSNVTQSDIASDHIAPGQGLVCATPLPAAGGGQSCGQCTGSAGGCGDTHFLSRLLDGRGRLAPRGAVNSVASFQRIVDTIDAQRPLPVRIHWPDGQGHFVCVSGYEQRGDGRSFVTVHDPLSPGVGGGAAVEFDMVYDDFARAYDASSGSGGVPNYFYEVQ